MLNQPTLKEMLAVMETEHPARQQHRAHDGFGATKALGRIEGFQEALNMLRSFAEPLPANVEAPKITWGAQEPDETQTR